MMKFKIEPWAHQLEAIKRASVIEDGYALLFEMGTGKSLTAINIVRAKCYQRGRVLRTLVLCPPVVKQNWKREFVANSTIAPDKITVMEGSGKKRREMLDATAGPIVITNYESLTIKDLFEAIREWRPEIIIFDESHRLKNYKAKRTKLAIELADRADYKLLLTGTPILNTPMDIWAQYRILDGGQTFDRNFFAFRARYFEDKNAGMPAQKYFPNWQPRAGIAENFHAKIYNKASRVLKKDCLDLPPMVRKRVYVEMGPEQKKMYESMKKFFLAYLDDKACVATIALTKLLRLQQIACGFFVDDMGKVTKFPKNQRLEALREILEAVTEEHKVIVWATFRDSYEDISKVCCELDLHHVTLYGGMTDAKRQSAVDTFQTDPSARVIIANQAAGGTGVNLTAASYAVYFSRTFNLEHDLQSEARNHRGGSEVHDSIIRVDLVCPDTVDEVILDALARKENLANNILRVRELL